MLKTPKLSRLLLVLLVSFVAHQQAFALSGPSDSNAIFQAGPGFFVGGGSAQPGVGVGISKKFSGMPLYLGFESGVFIQSGIPTGVGTDTVLNLRLPVLATAMYRIQTGGELVPTLGASVGGILSIGSMVPKAFMFMVLANPGFQFYLDPDMDLFFRASLGIMDSAFVFYPQIGATFRL